MEPQLEGCGKIVLGRRGRFRVRASMEPQLEGCGKFHVALNRPRAPLLQWSRNLRVAESRHKPGVNEYDDELQWSRNLRVAESAAARHQARVEANASMEPQLEGCGKASPNRGR